MQDISGEWTGTIIYGKMYGERANSELHFDLQMRQTPNQIGGTATDTSGVYAHPDPARFVGSFKNNQINFIKQYPCNHYVQNGKIVIDKSEFGPNIYYSGKYNEKNQTFSGKWVIKTQLTVLWIFYVTYKSRGRWNMRRK